MVPDEGFEPPTFGLQNRCTTTVLIRHTGWRAASIGKLGGGVNPRPRFRLNAAPSP
jgi:hypothetical protein